MAELYRALSVDINEDLKPLASVLAQHGVPCRIFEEGGRQVVMVERADHAEQVRRLYAAWREGRVQIEPVPQSVPATLRPPVQWRRAPVTLCLAVLCVIGFGLVYLHAPMSWLSVLTFQPFTLQGDDIQFYPIDGQYWRLVTPVFLHFGWLHIVFNTLWLWDLGGRVEMVLGHFNMLMLFLVIAVVSNASQFMFSGPGLFGGMSGVVYGLLGFSWVAPLLRPAWRIQPPTAVMVLMVGWLVACMAGVVEVLGFGAIANAAHLGGLICGGVLGAVFGAVGNSGGDKRLSQRL